MPVRELRSSEQIIPVRMPVVRELLPDEEITVEQRPQPFLRSAALGGAEMGGNLARTLARFTGIPAVADALARVTGNQINIPSPSGEDIFAATQAATGPGNFMDDFQAARQREQAMTQRLQEEAPVQSMMGRITPDIATLIALKQPSANLLKVGQAGLRQAGILPTSTSLVLSNPSTQKGARAFMKELAWRSRQELANITRRAAEGAVEGGVLAAMNDGGTGTGAAIGAVSGGIGETGSAAFSKLGTKTGLATIAVGGALLTALRDDRVFANTIGNFMQDVTTIGIGGGVAGLLAPRLPGIVRRRLGRNVESILAGMPRQIFLATINDIANSPQAADVSETIATNPEFFTAKELDELSSQIAQGKTISQATNTMAAESKRFMHKLNKLRQKRLEEEKPVGGLLTN